MEDEVRMGLSPAGLEAEAARAFERGDFEEALVKVAALCAAQPREARHACSHGLVLNALDRFDEAIAWFSAALALEPRFPEALVNWAAALSSQGDAEGAIGKLREALEIDPEHAIAANNLGTLLMEHGDLAQARALFERLAADRPDYAPARLNLGVAALFEGDFEAGWRGYEWRLQALPREVALRRARRPALGAAALGRPGRVAVLAEQGLGDQLLFSTLLPEFYEAAITPVVEVDARLLPAYRRSLPVLDFVSSEEMEAAIDTCDYEVPLGSLARFWRASPEAFARQPESLFEPDQGRMRALEPLLPPGPKIGISWHSFQPRARRRIELRKSLSLGQFAAFEGIGVHLVDLQYGDMDAERRHFDRSHPGLRVQVEALDLFADLEGVLALIGACDLVITASNVTAHLAGVLGKRTWLVLAGGPPPYHYWVPDDRGRSRWYPSVEIVSDPAWRSCEEAFAALARRWKREREG